MWVKKFAHLYVFRPTCTFASLTLDLDNATSLRISVGPDQCISVEPECINVEPDQCIGVEPDQCISVEPDPFVCIGNRSGSVQIVQCLSFINAALRSDMTLLKVKS